MRKTAIKLTILCMILLVSMSGIVLGAMNNATNMSNINDTSVDMNTSDVTATPTVADTANMSTTADNQGQGAVAPTQEGVANPTVTDTTADNQGQGAVVPTQEVPTSPQDTVVPTAPAQTPKSPGFGSVVAIAAVLLLAMYIKKSR